MRIFECTEVPSKIYIEIALHRLASYIPSYLRRYTSVPSKVLPEVVSTLVANKTTRTFERYLSIDVPEVRIYIYIYTAVHVHVHVGPTSVTVVGLRVQCIFEGTRVSVHLRKFEDFVSELGEVNVSSGFRVRKGRQLWI